MSKKVVILESPAKARTISGYLGKDYVVRASNGHVRDLPADEFGVDTDRGFEPTYKILAGRQKIIKGLREETKDADTVYLATDPDREGEAIAWHLLQALKLDEQTTKRVTYHEITRKAVQEAFQHPADINMSLVNAQQARRILDRIVGYELSPLISSKITRGLSAGRVQSVAVRLIVEREREIEAFKPQEFWRLTAVLQKDGSAAFEALLKKLDGKDAAIPNEAEAQRVLGLLKGAEYRVGDIRKRRSQRAAAAPFITSTMQQAASTQLRWGAEKTMRIAQQLYEGIDIGSETVGLITYMRTDSTRVADSAIEECRKIIVAQFGEDFLPPKPNTFKMPKGAQAAHEAIRPTDPNRLPRSMEQHLTPDQRKLYKLVWDRFTASQMKPAVYDVTEVDVLAGPALFEARGKQVVFEGWMRVAGTSELTESESKGEGGEEDKEGEARLPELASGDPLSCRELRPSQHFTQPPPRYSEATLIRALERLGIGRPSTYATIVSTIQKRNYVRQARRVFYATPLGCEVTDQLVQHFPREMDVTFTSQMEEDLDGVEEGRKNWQQVLAEFYKGFRADLAAAKEAMKRSDELREGEPTACPDCGKSLVPRFSKQGDRFLGCSGFPECKYTFDPRRAAEEPVMTEHKCPKCGSPMQIKRGRTGREFLACSAYPACRCIMGLDKEGKPVVIPEPEETGETCEKCGSPMVIKTGRRGRFMACSAFPRCRNAKPLPEEAGPPPAEGAKPESAEPTPAPEPCEQCGSPMVVRRGRRGPFLACSAYPKCKNTRPLGGAAAPAREAPQPSGETCEKCGSPMVVRKGRWGPFLGCSAYPKCKNTRKMAPGEKAEPDAAP